MTDTAAILDAYPAGLGGVDEDALIICLEQCRNCAQTATSCADACLREPDPGPLARCISAALVCADIADVTAATVSRLTGYDPVVTRAVLDACIKACGSCYDQCRKQALSHEHCRICAEACHRCADACRRLLTTTPRTAATEDDRPKI